MSVSATDIVQKDRFVGRGELDLVLARTVLGTLPGQALVIANTSSPVLRVDAPVGKVSFKRDREIVVLEVGSHFSLSWESDLLDQGLLYLFRCFGSAGDC